MKYKLIAIVFCSMLLIPAAKADIMMEPIMNFMPDDTGIRLDIDQKSVSVYNAQGLTLQVISITGKQVFSVKIENVSQRIELNIPKGCYILKVGSVVRKVSIR